MSSVICQNCAQPNPDVALVCRYCGHALRAGVAPRRPTDYAPPPQGSYTPTHGWASSAPLPPQPLAVAPHAPAVAAPQDFRCPYCHTNAPPVVASRISTGGWVVFAALLIACFPLCFIGLFIKEEYRMCSWCRAPLP